MTLFFFSSFLKIPENPWAAASQNYKKAWWNEKYETKKVIQFMILL